MYNVRICYLEGYEIFGDVDYVWQTRNISFENMYKGSQSQKRLASDLSLESYIGTDNRRLYFLFKKKQIMRKLHLTNGKPTQR